MSEKPNETPMTLAEALTMFPGFRFSPTDDELISFYLKKKFEGSEKSVEVIPEIEIWKHEPWDFPAKSIIQSDHEWFFFSPRGRKYPNGSQSKRATASGFWKATGKERNVKSNSNLIGTKRTLVFHIGRAPKGERTEWIMHEYCSNEKSQDSLVICRLRKKSDFGVNESSNQETSQRFLLPAIDSNSAVYVVGIDQTAPSEGNRIVDRSSKRCSSSYDSQSIEQIDSALESDHLKTNKASEPGFSSYHKDAELEDCFADILKDDIIKLDETPPAAPYLMPETHRKSKMPLHGVPLQGTANRRIRLRMLKWRRSRREPFAISMKKKYVIEASHPNKEDTPKSLMRLFSLKTVSHRVMFVLVIVIISVMLVLFGD
ncbi:NAC domain [Dillenia turbinata]|uniref:NAC domain n=1 Tax=Dillenia turbinata TaxID=194707 RepID=A0AAN8ZD65_9MAGN